MLLSDMLEDCDNVNFERRAPDASETARILEQTEQARELPNLGGVRVYVVGATADSTERSKRRKFLAQTHLKRCGATAGDADYTHYLINFALHPSEVRRG